jgi:sec-independent protein translocase protein TatA
MFSRFGWPELLIVLVIVVLVFGVDRITKSAKDIGAGIRGFKDGLKGEEEKKQADDKKDPDKKE